MGLSSEVLSAISDLGFEYPTEIQEQVLGQYFQGTNDIIGLSQTGTGKTAAFSLPILETILPKGKNPQALILSPTRELCIQIGKDIENYSKYMKGVKVTTVYGGDSIVRQKKAIKQGTEIVAATPGRLVDLIKRGDINLGDVSTLVLDEADIMLNMGFKEELDFILEATPENRRTLLFSATMPKEVRRIAENYMNNAQEITAGTKNAGLSTIEHKYYMVHSRDKYLALKRLVDFYPDVYGIVFCRTRAACKDIADKMMRDGYNSEALHGDLSQAQRESVMNKFRDGNVQLLIATDIAARGLDVDDLTHVIHFDLPDENEVYTHRSGRTGRAGKTGMSLAIINMREKSKIRNIEKSVKVSICEDQVPRGKDICAHQLMHLIDKVDTVQVDTKEIDEYMPMIEEKLAHLSREELLKQFVSVEFNRFLAYYKDTKDLAKVTKAEQRNAKEKPSKNRKNKQKRLPRGKKDGYTGIQINLGKSHKIKPVDLIGLVNQSTRCRDIEIGRINIDSKKSRLEVPSQIADMVQQSMDGFTFKGKKVAASIR